MMGLVSFWMTGAGDAVAKEAAKGDAGFWPAFVDFVTGAAVAGFSVGLTVGFAFAIIGWRGGLGKNADGTTDLDPQEFIKGVMVPLFGGTAVALLGDWEQLLEITKAESKTFAFTYFIGCALSIMTLVIWTGVYLSRRHGRRAELLPESHPFRAIPPFTHFLFKGYESYELALNEAFTDSVRLERARETFYVSAEMMARWIYRLKELEIKNEKATITMLQELLKDVANFVNSISISGESGQYSANIMVPEAATGANKALIELALPDDYEFDTVLKLVTQNTLGGAQPVVALPVHADLDLCLPGAPTAYRRGAEAELLITAHIEYAPVFPAELQAAETKDLAERWFSSVLCIPIFGFKGVSAVLNIESDSPNFIENPDIDLSNVVEALQAQVAMISYIIDNMSVAEPGTLAAEPATADGD